MSRSRCGCSTWRPPGRDALILSAGLGPDEPVKATSVAMRLLDERFDRRTGHDRRGGGIGFVAGGARLDDDSTHSCAVMHRDVHTCLDRDHRGGDHVRPARRFV